jgi:hypothetical protein
MTRNHSTSIRNIALATLALLVAGCDCMQEVNVTVVDATSGKPIPGALVYENQDQHLEHHTDEKGNFEFHDISGGLMGCPDVALVVEMDGYKSAEVEIENNGSQTVRLEKVASH